MEKVNQQPKTIREPVFDAFLALAKHQILLHVAAGRFTGPITCVADLDNFADVNAYGDLCIDEVADQLIDCFGGRDADEGMPQGMLAFIKLLHDWLNMWIEAGGLEDPQSAEIVDDDLDILRSRLFVAAADQHVFAAKTKLYELSREVSCWKASSGDPTLNEFSPLLDAAAGQIGVQQLRTLLQFAVTVVEWQKASGDPTVNHLLSIAQKAIWQVKLSWMNGWTTEEEAIREAIAEESGVVSVTVDLRIYDARAFRRAAYSRALKDGLDHQQASEYLSREKMSLGECGMMLIDPGVSPDGASIEGSRAD